MFRFTIRDALWLLVVVVVGFTLLAIAQSASQATMEGNASAVVVCLAVLIAAFRIARNAQGGLKSEMQLSGGSK